MFAGIDLDAGCQARRVHAWHTPGKRTLTGQALQQGIGGGGGGTAHCAGRESLKQMAKCLNMVPPPMGNIW